MINILVLLLFCLLIGNYFINGKEILAPSFLFTASFCLSGVWALFYQSEWGLDLHTNTFLVILMGTVTFTIVSGLIELGYSQLRSAKESEIGAEIISVKWWKIVIIGLIIIVTILYTITTIKRIAPAGSLSDSIYLYRSQTVNEVLFQNRNLDLPKLLIFLRVFSDSAGYFFAYLFAKTLITIKKVNVLFLVIIVLSIVDSFLLGSRTAAFRLIVCLLIYMYCVYKQNNNWDSKGNVKSIVLAIVIFFLIVGIFQSLATLLGRNTTEFSMFNYLAMYLGAEIKNLDIFLQGGMFPVSDGTWGGQTFNNINNIIANHLGLGQSVRPDLPFLSVNGFSLGNVYTTFYSYIYDYGYIGIPILTGVMAIISQVFFIIVRHKKRNGKVPISLLIYSRIAVTLLLSFFSNKFYEELFTVNFFEMIVVWIILNFSLITSKKNKLV